MADIMTLMGSSLKGISIARNIVGTIIEAKKEIDNATLNLQLSKLMNQLADSERDISDIKVKMLEKDNEVQQLKEKIESMNSNKRPSLQDGCYKFEGEEGLFCTACWDANWLKIQTTRLGGKFRQCPKCQAMLRA